MNFKFKIQNIQRRHIVYGLVAIAAIGAACTTYYFMQEKIGTVPYQNVREYDPSKELTRLSAGKSTLTVINKGPDGTSDKVLLNGVVVAENDHAGIERVFPNIDDPDLAIVWDDCGGTICGNATATFVDLKSPSGFYASLPMVSAEGITVQLLDKSGTYLINGFSSSSKNEYGDPLKLLIAYGREKSKLFIFPQSIEGAHPYDEFVGKHPDVLLGNPEARSIFLRVMTPEEFTDFRTNISVSGVVSEHNYQMQYSASGMAPHSGGDPAAFFVIDNFNSKVFAAVFRDGRFRVFTDIRGNMDYFTLELIDGYLEGYGAYWDTERGMITPR